MTAAKQPVAIAAKAPSAHAAANVLQLARERHHRTRRSEHRSLILMRIAVLAIFLVAWELASGTVVRPFFVSSPSAVGERLVEWIGSGELLYHGQFTLTATVLGYIVGSLAAIAIAWPLGLMDRAYRVTEPYFLIAYAVPATAM